MLHFGYMFGYIFEICDCERPGELDDVHSNVYEPVSVKYTFKFTIMFSFQI